MTAEALIASLDARGISLLVDDEALRFRAPKDALSAELRQTILEHRDEIIAHLKKKPVGLGDMNLKNCSRCDTKDWVDEPPRNGRIRTRCRRCGRFIGYRTVASRHGKPS